LSGTVDSLWSPNIASLKQVLAGMPKNMLQPFFAKDAGIVEANVQIFPPWEAFVSKDLSKIDIIEK
jgi:hypothetical protein